MRVIGAAAGQNGVALPLLPPLPSWERIEVRVSPQPTTTHHTDVSQTALPSLLLPRRREPIFLFPLRHPTPLFIIPTPHHLYRHSHATPSSFPRHPFVIPTPSSRHSCESRNPRRRGGMGGLLSPSYSLAPAKAGAHPLPPPTSSKTQPKIPPILPTSTKKRRGRLQTDPYIFRQQLIDGLTANSSPTPAARTTAPNCPTESSASSHPSCRGRGNCPPRPESARLGAASPC